MTNPATPKLLSIIRKIREERRSGDLTRLTDAELVARLDDRFHEPDHGTGDLLVDSSFAVR